MAKTTLYFELRENYLRTKDFLVKEAQAFEGGSKRRLPV